MKETFNWFLNRFKSAMTALTKKCEVQNKCNDLFVFE